MSQYVLLVFDDERQDFNGETDQEVFLRRFGSYKAMRDQIGSHHAVELFLTEEEETEIRNRRSVA